MWLFSSLACFNFGVEGFQSRYTSIPSKPTFSHAGNDVTFTWRYHLTHSDRANFKVVVFGIWMNGDISIPLVSVLRNGSAIFYSNRVSWLGNKTIASFRLHKVSIDDDRVYGCKLDFGAFDVLDSVRLTVIAAPQIKKSKNHQLAQVKVSEGQSVVIPCKVTGNPPPWISWSQDGRVLQNSTRKHDLLINSAEEHMTGLYRCRAENEAGVDKYDVLLLVISCDHQSGDVAFHAQENKAKTQHNLDGLSKFHAQATLASTLVVVFALFVIFGAYFFFRYTGARNKRPRKYTKMPQDEQARSLLGEWSSFTDNGAKI